jgi:hypothetical protein
MWSGPRNISTAMMRAWENRPDTAVCDEPFYAHYLLVTGKPHPGAEEVIAHHESDWRRVAKFLTGEIPDGRAIFYQKHMAHHLLPIMGREWLSEVTNCFLIRDSREMLSSLIRVTPEITIVDTGLPQQWEIFARVSDATGSAPPVVDARDVLLNPAAMLRRLCHALDVPFDEAMLHWPPGPRPTDGIWAKHWYAAVEASTSFEPYRAKESSLPDHLLPLYEECLTYYHRLYPHRLTPD